jgi:alpha-glucosidase
MLVGENSDVRYYGNGDNELHMAFNFPLMKTDRITPNWVRANQQERLASLPPGAWPCNTLNNHDTSRHLTRYGDGRNNEAIARTSLALMLTMRGTPFLYNGEEIGMADYFLPDISLFGDPPAVWFYHQEIAEGTPSDVALARAARDSRDRCRTPLQWKNAPNAGFSPSGVRTWLPVNPNHAEGVNVADQQDDPKSMLNFYRQMLRLRKETPALIFGDYAPIHEKSNEYFAFLRKSTSPDQTCLVVLNLSERPQKIDLELPQNVVRCLYPMPSTNTSESLSQLELAPFGIYIGELISS